MDPKFRGELLNEVMDNLIDIWISKNCSAFLCDILSFTVQDQNIYPKYMFEEKVITNFSSIKWWQIIEEKSAKFAKGPSPDFFKLMKSLISLPVKVAYINRSSTQIWSKIKQCDKNGLKLLKMSHMK